MSRLLIVCRPALVPGFQLAGVDAYAAADVAEARSIIRDWLRAGEVGLLAVDESLLAQFDDEFRHRMQAAHQLPFLALPAGEPLPPETSAREMIAEMIRRAVGFHFTFQRKDKP